MTPEQIERYKRHFLVKEIGGHGQKKLLDAHVLIVGDLKRLKKQGEVNFYA